MTNPVPSHGCEQRRHKGTLLQGDVTVGQDEMKGLADTEHSSWSLQSSCLLASVLKMSKQCSAGSGFPPNTISVLTIVF